MSARGVERGVERAPSVALGSSRPETAERIEMLAGDPTIDLAPLLALYDQNRFLDIWDATRESW